MEELKMLKKEVEEILLKDQTTKENNLAFADGILFALSSVTSGYEDKDKFLTDYANGILHASSVLYGEKIDSEKSGECILVHESEDVDKHPQNEISSGEIILTMDTGNKNSAKKCTSLKEAKSIVKRMVQEEKLKCKKELGYSPVVTFSLDETSFNLFYKDKRVSCYKIYKL